MAFGPWRDTEFFLATGRGFHSNDARGATIDVDPKDGVTPVDSVTPLAKAKGSEIGMRTAFIPQDAAAAEDGGRTPVHLAIDSQFAEVIPVLVSVLSSSWT